MARPDFLGIGAQRAGTTWLHRNLRHHRDVWLTPAPLKEVHFFDELYVDGHENSHKKRTVKLGKLAARYERRGRATPEIMTTIDHLREAPRDDDWYSRLFSLGPPGKVLGEITPAYSLAPVEGIEHMLRINPELKFILMLRHPIDRSWSQVRYTIGRRQEGDAQAAGPVPHDELRRLAFSEANRQRSDYRAILERYRSRVPSGQLHIAFYDRIREEPEALLDEIARFLGVKRRRFDTERMKTAKRHNDSPPIAMPPELSVELADLYRDDVRWLVDHLPGVPQRWLDKTERYAAPAGD